MKLMHKSPRCARSKCMELGLSLDSNISRLRLVMKTKKRPSQSTLLTISLVTSWSISLLGVYRVSSRELRKEKDLELKLSEAGRPSGLPLPVNVLTLQHATRGLS